MANGVEEKVDTGPAVTAELLMDLLDQERSIAWDRETGVYHPSSMRGCRRAMAYDRTGAPAKNIATIAMRRWSLLGKGVHLAVQDVFSRVPGFQSEVYAGVPEWHIAGSCDGVFYNEDYLVDIKTMGNISFNVLRAPKKEHIWQVHCYMKAFGIGRAEILCINRDTGAARAFVVYFSQEVWDEVTSTIEDIEAIIAKGGLPDREPSKFTCENCRFLDLCKPVFNTKTSSSDKARLARMTANIRREDERGGSSPSTPTIKDAKQSPGGSGRDGVRPPESPGGRTPNKPKPLRSIRLGSKKSV